MNKALFLLLGFLCFSASNAQEFSVGIKGGPSYVMGGQISGREGNGADFSETVNANSSIKFHAGAFFEFRSKRIFIRPEILYSSMETEFVFPRQNSKYALQKLSVPLLLGYNFPDVIDIYAGPAYQKILDASLEGNRPNRPVIAQNNPLAIQIGLKTSFTRIDLDLRYDRTLATNKPYIINIQNTGPDGYGINSADFDDSSLDQILLSINFKIFNNGGNRGRRRGRSYY